jgi:hypothetical protein
LVNNAPNEPTIQIPVGFFVIRHPKGNVQAVVMPPLVWASRPGRLPRLPQILSVIVALVGAVWLVERLVNL